MTKSKKQPPKVTAKQFDEQFEKGSASGMLKTVLIKKGLEDAKKGRFVKAREDFSKYIK